MKIFGRCSYKGTNYYGWQKQVDYLSVQATIEEALSKVYNSKIDIVGSGRTDAGTHALKQCFHYVCEREKDLNLLTYSLNKMLPDDIKIISLEVVDDNFHARYSAKRKVYEYHIVLDGKDPFAYEFSYVFPMDFDFVLFKEALLYFKGEHNFQNFTSKEEDEDNFIRTIYMIDVDKTDNLIKVTFEGNGFMRYQIRNMVGSAISVASKKEEMSFIKNRLDNLQERNIVSYKAPSCGLYLVDVMY